MVSVEVSNDEWVVRLGSFRSAKFGVCGQRRVKKYGGEESRDERNYNHPRAVPCCVIWPLIRRPVAVPVGRRSYACPSHRQDGHHS